MYRTGFEVVEDTCPFTGEQIRVVEPVQKIWNKRGTLIAPKPTEDPDHEQRRLDSVAIASKDSSRPTP